MDYTVTLPCYGDDDENEFDEYREFQ